MFFYKSYNKNARGNKVFNSEILMEIFQQYHTIAVLISLTISVLVALAGVIPSVFVTAANILFFGPWMGFVISLLGEVVGGYISFLAYRKGFKKATEKLIGKYKLIDRLVHSDGMKAGLLIFQGRLLPFVPSGIVTLASSVSDVNGTIYNIATLLGKIPSIALEVLISYQFINIEENLLNFVITIVILITMYITIKKYSKF